MGNCRLQRHSDMHTSQICFFFCFSVWDYISAWSITSGPLAEHRKINCCSRRLILLPILSLSRPFTLINPNAFPFVSQMLHFHWGKINFAFLISSSPQHFGLLNVKLLPSWHILIASIRTGNMQGVQTRPVYVHLHENCRGIILIWSLRSAFAHYFLPSCKFTQIQKLIIAALLSWWSWGTSVSF